MLLGTRSVKLSIYVSSASTTYPAQSVVYLGGGALFPVLNYDLTGLMFVFGLCWGGSMGMLSLLYHRAVRVMKIK